MEAQVFNFNNDEVQVVINDKNEPMFVATDICAALGLTNTTEALRSLDEDEKLPSELLRAGRLRNVNMITESGLYSLVLRSNKPQAKVFKKWITSEVLPSIRRHGMYANKQTVEEMLENPDILIQTLQTLKKEREEKERLLIQNELQDKQLKISAPKVEYYDEVLQSNSTYNTNQIAKELGMSAVGLNATLNDLGIQYKQSGTWLLYHKYQNKGYTKTKTHSFTDNHGNTQTVMSTVWTEKGRLFIHENITVQKAV
jgi:prophage antirepressor-like protein